MEREEVLHLTPEEKSTFEQLREIISRDYGENEATCDQIYRFLKARNFDLQQSETMLRNHIEWRKDKMKMLKTYKMSKLQEENLRIIITSYTKSGEPVAYLDLGSIDFKGLLKSVKGSELVNGFIKDIITLEKNLYIQNEKVSKTINKWIVILNFEKFSLTQVLYKPNVERCIEAYSLYESNFPERLHTAYVINASPVFTILFNILKPIVPVNTLAKIKIYGKVGWKEELLKQISAEDLPVFLGGKKTGEDGNEFCNTLITNGPIPKHFYFRSSERRLKGKKYVKEFILKGGEKYHLELCVNVKESVIFWNFETEKGDIIFGMFYYLGEQGTTMKEILPCKVLNAHTELEQGSYTCHENGTYILLFDNTHSWLKEKRIFCKAYVKFPDGEEVFFTH